MAMQKYRYTIPDITRNSVGRYTRHQQEEQTTRDGATGDIPAHGSYGSLLFDPRWKSKRAEIMIRDNNCCVVCSSADELQVHHRQYHFIKAVNGFKMPWAYSSHLLITLCKSCHQRGHSKFKVPTLII